MADRRYSVTTPAASSIDSHGRQATATSSTGGTPQYTRRNHAKRGTSPNMTTRPTTANQVHHAAPPNRHPRPNPHQNPHPHPHPRPLTPRPNRDHCQPAANQPPASTKQPPCAYRRTINPATGYAPPSTPRRNNNHPSPPHSSHRPRFNSHPHVPAPPL